MVIGGVALLLSGLVLWFVASIPWELRVRVTPPTLVHAIAALVTIGGFIIHLYMGLAVCPRTHAIVHGDVTEEWARHHHALWLRRRSPLPHAQPANTDIRTRPRQVTARAANQSTWDDRVARARRFDD